MAGIKEKIDTSPEEEAIKEDAREFMTGLVGSGMGDQTTDCADAPTSEGAEIIKAWISKFSDTTATMEDFWSVYDPYLTSIWSMVYDEADSNENLEQTIGFVVDLLNKPGMANLKRDHDCFGVVHTLENLSIEGIWLFNGPDPTKLFGANEDTSWYTFTQLGPYPNEHVKAAVACLLAPKDGPIDGKKIQNTQTF